jgi:hypothetical protein
MNFNHTRSDLVLRTSASDDERALERLAALDSRQRPTGTFLVAEVEGDLVAAAPLGGDSAPFSDPFRRTTSVVELLSLRVRQLAAA